MAIKFKKRTFSILCVIVILFVSIPPITYSYSIGLLDSMPQKTSNSINNDKALEIWQTVEKNDYNKCASITPYWMYSWLLMAFVNDFIYPVEPQFVYGNISKMASQIAIRHISQNHFKSNVGMLSWHITNLSLCIWLQRNWSAHEIVSKYKTLSA